MRLAVREAGLDTATDFLCSEKGRMIDEENSDATTSLPYAKSKYGTYSLLPYYNYTKMFVRVRNVN